MSPDTVKLPRSSYEELRKIITAYGRLSTPSGLDEISQRTGISRTSVSDNNAFLAAAGIIEGGKKKGPTPRGQSLARALQHEIPEEVEKEWALIVQESDFLNKMLQAVAIRRGMQRAQLEAHVAYSAGEPRTDSVMTGARAVVDILKASGLVKEEDGQILPSASTPRTFQESTEPNNNSAESPETQHTTKVNSRAGYPITIQLNINVTPQDLESLPDQIKKFLDDLDGTLSTPSA